jgi:hypothetical protein
LLRKVVSGGQSGVDRAALDAARELGIPNGGWCPRGRLAEDGRIARRYRLVETPSGNYVQRTEWKVRDSDGTLIVNRGRLDGGTLLTAELALGPGKIGVRKNRGQSPISGISAPAMGNRALTPTPKCASAPMRGRAGAHHRVSRQDAAAASLPNAAKESNGVGSH